MGSYARAGGGPAARRPMAAPHMSGRSMMTEEQAAATWEKLRDAIDMIHQCNTSTLSFEELYRSAYNMVLHRHGNVLYRGMEDSLRAHLHKVSKDFESKAGLSFVKDVLAKWAAYHRSTQLIGDILMYMDNTYVRHMNRATAFDRGMEIWAEEIITKPEIGRQLQDLFLEQVAKERSGEGVQRAVLADVTKMMLQLGKDVYVSQLEKPFLLASREFFQGQVQRCLASMDCPEYFVALKERISLEEERVSAYLHEPSTKHKLLQIVDEIYISDQLSTVLTMENSGFLKLLDDDKHDALAGIYTICMRVAPGGPNYIRDLLHDHVQQVGKALVADTEAAKDAVLFTQRALDLRDKFAATISLAFQSDRQFLQALNSAFESFLNMFARGPEYVSLYIDHRLRKGLPGLNDSQADETLDKVLQIFRYLQDKDMFERYYKQHLSKRLLSGRTTNDDVEHTMLAKLKTECGYQFTSKLESMFMDIKTSSDTMASFRQHLQANNTALGVELSVQVLTTGSWPTTPSAMCALPAELEQCTAAFEQFYHEKHSGRQLTWHSAMGNADLKATIQGRRLLITVTTHQMCALMLLNDQPKITFAELLEATKVPREDLKPALIGLSLLRGRMLLRKEPAGRTIADTDVFSFNDAFDPKLMRIKFAAAGGTREVEVDRGTRQKFEEDRKHIVEAAIVRIMKSRRVLDYNSIIAEVTRQMSNRFVPLAADIKKRIESLIEREFLERDQVDRKVYRYLA